MFKSSNPPTWVMFGSVYVACWEFMGGYYYEAPILNTVTGGWEQPE